MPVTVPRFDLEVVLAAAGGGPAVTAMPQELEPLLLT